MTPMMPHPITTEHALLGFLRQSPMHGYELMQLLNNPTGLGLVWRLKQSQVYALLSKLEENGLLVASVEPQENRPPRKVFRLTEAGSEALDNWLASPVSRPRELRLDFLAKLFFCRQESMGKASRLIERQRERCQRWLKEYESRAAQAADEAIYDRLVWQLRMKQIESMLDWLRLCEETLVLDGAF